MRIMKTAEKINWHYIALVVIILCGTGILFASCWIIDFIVGLGTGIVTSALVTLYIEIINTKIECKKAQKWKGISLESRGRYFVTNCFIMDI